MIFNFIVGYIHKKTVKSFDIFPFCAVYLVYLIPYLLAIILQSDKDLMIL